MRSIVTHHLDGLSVTVVEDGTDQGTHSVTDGSVDYTPAGDYFVAGLPYTSEVATMPMNLQAQDGPAYGKEKRVIKVTPYLFNTVGVTHKVDGKTHRTQPDSSLTTGFTDLNLVSRFTMDTTFSIMQDKPYPSTILSLVMEVDK